MARKLKGDGAVSINRIEKDDGRRIVVTVTTDGETTAIVLSDYNAWRVFGLLGLMLNVHLPHDIAKKIDF